jgi:RNA polymerase sigma-70 factor (ECF subfamily)
MAGMGPDDDAVAIRESRRDPRAFAAVFDRHFDGVHAFARRRVGGDLADEIAAETFARAFDQRGRYDLAVPDARPWLLGIAANLMRRHWRAERRRLAAYARHGAPSPAEADAFVGDGAALADALDGLRKGERDVLFLYALADLSYAEIAIALAIPIGTVRSRLARARGRLRERLTAVGSFEETPGSIEESCNA